MNVTPTRPASRPRSRSHTRLALLAALLLAPPAGAASLTVFAASSLTDAFTEIGRAFDARTGHRTTFQFAGSQVLRAQLEGGARADVFASANDAQFTPLLGSVVAAREVFARNRLTVIAPAGSARVRSLRDLTGPGVRLVLAAPNVPVGDYTRRMLAAVDRSGTYGKDFAARALRNVVSEEGNVRQVALKVSLGEADAAVVYASDVTPALKKTVRVVPLPTRFNQTAAYPLGVVRGSANADAARSFAAFVQGKEGQAILRRWGFLSP
ncbi:molybdenum ABC transporter periplasmic molybdate-binding protein [Deinococcus grandis]|uniref:Molybdenum ABC transporter periplasmic molybdate-binding protein n=1 Tax=Deinococcus grandis TaxID=57498 RepID=A0A117DRI6_9DEIO|nr:molybdate ABC transporter substrate-binding protein [Deinococcus grandis]BBN96769.1 molybdate ABC transporter substrate-binding protein [Deinococcus grandis]GAQ23264.1 molybdenum ABC transporter periplasmic molybdate-binding protein [Deinococcus grandis]